MIKNNKLSDISALELIFYQLMAGVRTNLPAIVDSEKPYKSGQFWCIDATPAINHVFKTPAGIETKRMPRLDGIPIICLSGGGYSVTVPIKKGDSIWLSVSDRGIDHWQATADTANPPELTKLRQHDITDCAAIVGGLNAAQCENYFNDGISLATADGTNTLQLTKEFIKIQDSGGGFMKLSSGVLEIKADIKHTGSNVQTGDYVQTGNITQTGNTTSSGLVTGSQGLATAAGTAISAAGAGSVSTLTSDGVVTSGGVNLSTHTHLDAENRPTKPPR